MSQGALTFAQLGRIEEKVAQHFGFTDFHNLGFGSFLSFLTKQPEPKKVLEHLIGEGMSLVGGGGGNADNGAKFQHSRDQVISFIKQCQVTSSSAAHKHVDDALCEYHGISNVRALGFGPLDKLVTAATSSTASTSSPSPSSDRVLYEKALCAKSSSYAGPLLTRARHGQSGQKLVGVMGAMTKEKAIECLRACPPLFDLEEWSQWPRIFEPQFGPLGEFILVGQTGKGGAGAETIIASDGSSGSSKLPSAEKEIVTAMEIQPGILIKLPSSSSAEEFGKCVERLDARTACGQLCHLVTSSFGPSNAPLTLLANHAQASLRKAEANSSSGSRAQSQHHPPAISSSVKFVFNCLQLLPIHVASATASQVFVEPLGLVVGAALSKRQILELAKQPKHLSKIQLLGWLMGIVEWSGSFADRLTGNVSIEDVEGSGRPHRAEPNSSSPFARQPSSSPFAPQPSRASSSSPFAPQPSKSSSSSPFAPQRNNSSPFATQPKKGAPRDSDSEDDDDNNVDMLEKDPLASDDDDEERELSAKENKLKEKQEGREKTAAELEADTEKASQSEDDKKLARKDKCRSFIEEIRRDDFGVGVEISDTASKLIAIQQVDILGIQTGENNIIATRLVFSLSRHKETKPYTRPH